MKWSIPEKMVEQGRKYADDGRVTKITQDLEQELWYAEVIGTDIYKVTLDGTPKEIDKCTCAEWPKKGYCKHTVAVELALRLKGLNRVLKQNKHLKTTYKAPSLGSLLSTELAKLQKQETEILLSTVQELQVSYLIESIPTSIHHGQRDIWTLSLKVGVGQERQYAIKNLSLFLENWFEGTTYELTDSQTILLTTDNFSEQDQQLMAMIWQIYNSQKVTATVASNGRHQLKPRHLLLPVQELSLLMTGLERQQKLNILINKIKYTSMIVVKAEKPFRFRVNPRKEGYRLIFDTVVQHYWAYYQWVMIADTIYELNESQIKVFEAVTQLLKRTTEDSIDFVGADIADLFTYVLPQLNVIGEVNMADMVESELIRQPLHIKLDLWEADNLLHTKVNYCYGDYIFSTDPAEEKVPEGSETVIRDLIQEERMHRLLEKYQYVKQARSYVKAQLEGEALFQFYTKELPRLRKVAEVTLSKELQEKYLDGLQHTPKIEVTENGSWFDVNFDITGIAEEDVNGLVLSLMEQKSYHQLADGKIIALDTENQAHSEALLVLRKYLSFDKQQFMIPKHQSVQLAEALTVDSDVSFSTDFTQMTHDLTHPLALTGDLPEGLDAELREYQQVGYRWLRMLNRYGFGGILADDMGLGKTIQAITYLLWEKTAEKKGPSLVVAPASLVYNWENECRKFAPSLKTAVVMGTKEEREKILEAAKSKDVLFVSYASLRQDEALYQTLNLSTLILDEAQMVKNSATKTFQAIKGLKTQHRFALSGTPIENKLEELWAIFAIVMPGFFPSKAKFNKLSANEVARMIKPFILRREKKTVLQDLPDKIESNLLSPLTENQKTTYLAHLRQMQQSVSGMDSQAFKENHLTILAGLTRLRQICCDPRLFIEDYEGGSGKLEQVKELIAAAKANGRRVLLFSQFTGMLAILEKELNEMAVETFYLHGGTKPKDRIEMVDQFNDMERDVFLISLKAGGTGLNLTGADTVILYDLWWNPAVEEQAASRAHRMGQKKVVEVWRLIAEGTIEEKMFHLQEGKRQLFDSVMTDDSGKQLNKLTEEDIRDILLITE